MFFPLEGGGKGKKKKNFSALLMSTLITAKELDIFTDDLMPADN